MHILALKNKAGLAMLWFVVFIKYANLLIGNTKIEQWSSNFSSWIIRNWREN